MMNVHIHISGPMASGKTHLARALQEFFDSYEHPQPINVKVSEQTTIKYHSHEFTTEATFPRPVRAKKQKAGAS